MIDYKKLVDEIKKTISNYQSKPFQYVERAKWVENVEPFPSSNIGRFTVFINSKTGQEDSSCINAYILDVNVQFVLDALNDGYLKNLGYCEDAVKLLRNISFSNIKIAESTNPYFELELSGNYVIVNFNGLQFVTD